MGKKIVEYFDQRHRDQVTTAEVPLNAFQMNALRFASGRVLDLACGVGAFSLAGARKGCKVVAVDASAPAIERLSELARAEGLDVEAVRHDVATYEPIGSCGTIVAIGILMFFPREVGFGVLERLQRAVLPEGHAIVTVLMEARRSQRLEGVGLRLAKRTPRQSGLLAPRSASAPIDPPRLGGSH